MFSKFHVAVAVVLVFGSTSTVFAATNAKSSRHQQRIERAAQPSSEGYNFAVPRTWGGCTTDDGGGRMRPCDFGGG